MAWTERYCSPAGGGAHDGTTAADAWTLAEAIANVAAGHRVNIIAGTYANTTTDRTFATNGTTTAPIWLRGYASAIGDLDDVADGAASGPAITFTTGRLIVTGSYYILSSLNVSGAQISTGQLRTATGNNHLYYRLRVECTSANANGRAAHLDAGSSSAVACWFKATATATAVVESASASGMAFVGNAFVGGGHGLSLTSTTTAVVVANSFYDNGGDAFRGAAAGRLYFLLNSVYSPGSDGVELLTTIQTAGLVAGNIFSECGGWGINNSTGTNTANLPTLFNLFHSNTSGTITGLGDMPSLAQQTDSASPFANAAGGDLSILSTSNAKANGPPKKFENQSYTSYLDIGAVQRQEAAAGGSFVSVSARRVVPPARHVRRTRTAVIAGAGTVTTAYVPLPARQRQFARPQVPRVRPGALVLPAATVTAYVPLRAPGRQVVRQQAPRRRAVLVIPAQNVTATVYVPLARPPRQVRARQALARPPRVVPVQGAVVVQNVIVSSPRVVR